LNDGRTTILSDQNGRKWVLWTHDIYCHFHRIVLHRKQIWLWNINFVLLEWISLQKSWSITKAWQVIEVKITGTFDIFCLHVSTNKKLKIFAILQAKLWISNIILKTRLFN
jgi:hypothetical protein